MAEHPDERYDEYDDWDRYDEAPAIWTDAEIADQIEDIFDEHREAVFRAKVKTWSHTHWVDAERAAHRVGTEARELLNDGHYGPAVVWSGTCVEIIFRELTLKPILVGLFLGEVWADKTVGSLLRNRWVGKEAREITQAVLKTVAGLDVTSFAYRGHIVWDEIPLLLKRRNLIVHEGATADHAEAQRAVDVVAGLYQSILPTMRDLCAMSELTGYLPPEAQA